MKKSLVIVLALIMAMTCLFAGCDSSSGSGSAGKVAGVPEEPGAAKNKVDVKEKKGKEYTTIEFGRYPATELNEKKNADLIASLNEIPENEKDSVTGYFTYEDKQYQKEIKIIKDEDGLDVEEIHWFEVSPIKWIVLDEADGKMLVVAEENVTAMGLTAKPEDTNWGVSDLRNWLNALNEYKDTTNFYNSAFNEDEKATIVTQDIKTGDKGDAVKDRVTLLSVEDFENDWADGLFEADKDGLTLGRACGNTEYAKFKGVVATNNYDRNNSSWYWLRNNGISAQHAAYVSEMGDVVPAGYTVSFPQMGVRPVLLLDANNLNVK